MEEGFKVEWRRVDTLKNSAYIACCLATGGLLALSAFSYPHWRKQFITSQCKPEEADLVVLTLEDKKHFSKAKHFIDKVTQEHAIVIEVECVRYIASNLDAFRFTRLPDAPANFSRFFALTYDEEQDKSQLQEEQRLLSAQYGPNVMHIPSSSFFHILMRQLLSPFFIFQYFASIVWFIEEYWTYATIIVVITFGSAILNAREAMFNLERLRQLAGVQTTIDIVESKDGLRNMSTSRGPDSRLLPGTKFLLMEGMVLPCDAVLLSGKVVVDESMLTGESVPVSKSPIDISGVGGAPADTAQARSKSVLRSMGVHNTKDPEEMDLAAKRPGNILFGGTRVRACYGEHCVAAAYRTGFRSAKGQLVASLLQPKAGLMNFVADALYIIGATTLTISFVYIAVAFRLKNLGASDIDAFFYYLDALTIAVPPGLTACLTIATSIAIDRLKRKEVFVSDTTRVSFAGMITAACFDKTGTLTENALQLLGALCTQSILDAASSTGSESDCVSEKEKENAHHETLHDYKASSGSDAHVHASASSAHLSTIGVPFLCQEIMATCHGLALEGEDAASARGDPLEEELLQASEWRLSHASAQRNGQLVAFPPSTPANAKLSDGFLVLKHFEFTPEKLRAASIVREPTGRVMYLLKGSPEVIVNLCDPKTVPAEISSALSGLAKEGLRVIAIACKTCVETNADVLLTRTQDEIESSADGSSIVFLGLLYLSSALKWDTKKTIYRLHNAQIHVNMITGDHIHTAISVGGSCGIIKFKTAHSAPTSEDTRRLVIVDEDPKTEQIVLIDATTEKVIPGLSLAELIFDAAQSYVMDMQITDSVFDFASNLEANERALDESDKQEREVYDPMNVFTDDVTGQDYHAMHDKSPPVVYAKKPRSADSAPLVEIAVTGKGLHAVFRQFPRYTALCLVRYAKIFARTKPYDKKYIVEALMESCPKNLLQMARAEVGLNLQCDGLISPSSFFPCSTSPMDSSELPPEEQLPSDDELLQTMHVLFCGDGANDMIALRAATVGVSLCDAETSVAAPVTSKEQTPGSVVEVLKEGRCSLVTAYVLILFNINYAVVQLCLCFSMYLYGIKLGNYMYLVQDMFFALFLGLAVSYSGPTRTLTNVLPPKRFFVPFIMSRLSLYVVSFIAFQVIGLGVLWLQSFYEPFRSDEPLTETYSYESTLIFNLSLAQLLSAAIVSTIGKPFREVWYKNSYFVILLLLLFAYVLFQVFGGDNYFLTDVMELKPMPVYFGFIEVGLMLLHLLVCIAIRKFCDRFFSLQQKNVFDVGRLLGKKKMSTSRAMISKSTKISEANKSMIE